MLNYQRVILLSSVTCSSDPCENSQFLEIYIYSFYGLFYRKFRCQKSTRFCQFRAEILQLQTFFRRSDWSFVECKDSHWTKKGDQVELFLQDFPGFECWKTFAKNSNQTHKMFFGQVIFCHPPCDVLKCVFLGVSTNVFLTCHLHLFTASWGQLRSDFPHYNAMVRYILWLNDKNNTKNMPRPGQSKGALEVDFTVPIVSPRQLHFTAGP